jgi:hypothetical protein
MEKILQILSGVFSAFLLVMAVRWVFDPAGAAEALQMVLMEGTGRNSQIGDVGAFFFGMGGFAAYGVWKKRPEFLFSAAFLIATAAVLRVFSGFMHDAPTIWSAVVFEVVVATVWITYGRKLAS